MSDWQPATEVETALREALALADQELYFRILAGSDLLLPVSADALAGRTPMGWGTWTTGNRTHVLAFTSPQALRACLPDPGSSYRTLPFAGLAADWPNYEWWLAVNPGLPIEAYLPSWFVSQLTRGDARVPGRSPGPNPRQPSDLAAAVNGRIRASGPGAPVAPVTAPPAAPAGSGPPAGPASFAGPGAVPPAASGPTGRRPGGPGPGSPASQPSSASAASHMGSASAASHMGSASAASHTGPASEGSDNGRLNIGRVDAGRFGLGFDRPSRDRRGFARSTVVETIDAEIVDDSPTAGVHPQAGRAGGAYQQASRPTSTEQPGRSRADLHDAEIVTAPAPAAAYAPGFIPANETEASLLTAKESQNTDAFLSTLLLARIIVPVPQGTPADARVKDKDFPWQVDQTEGRSYISVYTSTERLGEQSFSRYGPNISSISLPFVQLIAAWPDERVSFAVNPGSPVGATLPGAQIVALANWAVDVGLRGDTTADLVVAAKRYESTPTVGIAGAPTAGARQATLMQRTVLPAQLAYYLERGYDRVSGFINRANEVAHMSSPRSLYRALGLLYSGSPFSEDDTEVHVVRWAAHRADLYRIPYGGQHEAAMRAMQGWVIERPPFRGNGFAPGDTHVIAEFKVESVRLPHGAQMWRLTREGNQVLVATFDADTCSWIPPAGSTTAAGGRGGPHA